MEVPFYKKFLSGALIFLGIFAVGLGGGYALERAQMSGQRASVSNATTDGIYNINANPDDVLGKDVDSTSGMTAALAANSSLPEIKLTFAGDITLSGSVKTNVKNKLDGDYEKVFGAAKTVLEKSDITFGTFNGTFGINDANKSETKAAIALRNIGFDVLGTSFAGANRSVKNLIETTLVIDGNGLTHTGAGRSYVNAREPKLIEKNGVTVGYLAFTDNKTDWPLATENDAGLLSANDPQLEEIIAGAKAKSDVLVVSFN